MTFLIIGYGNPLREDDGVGWAVIERLQEMALAEPVTLIAAHQLLPELADLIWPAARVTFVDAAATGEPGLIIVTALTPDAAGPASSHQLGPAVLLAYTQQLYGKCPPAHLVTISASQFGYEERLSPLMEQKLGEICAEVVRVTYGNGL